MAHRKCHATASPSSVMTEATSASSHAEPALRAARARVSELDLVSGREELCAARESRFGQGTSRVWTRSARHGEQMPPSGWHWFWQACSSTVPVGFVVSRNSRRSLESPRSCSTWPGRVVASDRDRVAVSVEVGAVADDGTLPAPGELSATGQQTPPTFVCRVAP